MTIVLRARVKEYEDSESDSDEGSVTVEGARMTTWSETNKSDSK